MKPLFAVACLLLAALAPAHANDDAAERQRIARERAQAEARFRAQRNECQQRFVVTACVDAARAEHRQTTQRLRREEGVLDEAQRRQRAAARLAAIEEKQRAERERANAPRAPRAASEAAPRQPRPAHPRAAHEPASAPSPAERAAEEARKRERYEARQREAREHREQAEARRVQRDRKGKPPAAPLPDPAASR